MPVCSFQITLPDSDWQPLLPLQGSNGGTDKPKVRPCHLPTSLRARQLTSSVLAVSQFFRATMSGTIKDLKIINSPRQVFSIGNKSKLVIDGVTIDNRAGDALGSDGKPLGHNSCVARRVSLDSISL